MVFTLLSVDRSNMDLDSWDASIRKDGRVICETDYDETCMLGAAPGSELEIWCNDIYVGPLVVPEYNNHVRVYLVKDTLVSSCTAT